MRHFAQASIPLAFALDLASCSTGRHSPGVGQELTDVQVTTLDGTKQKLSEIQDGRVLVFKFGATWCGWCNRQLADFNRVHKAYDDENVVVLDIDIEEPAAEVASHARKAGVTFATVLDPNGEAAGYYRVRGIPVTIVADHEGTIVYRGNYTTFAALKKAIDPAVEKLEASRGKSDDKS